MNRNATATATAPRTQSSHKRQFRVCAPVKRESQGQTKTFWPRLGTAWENEPRDGKPATISIRLDSNPIGGELVLFEDDGQGPEGDAQ